MRISDWSSDVCSSDLESALLRLAAAFPNNVFLGAGALYQGDDHRRLAALARLAQEVGVGLAACNDVRMHAASRQPLLDTVTCIRAHCTIDAAGYRLEANAERTLQSPAEMAPLLDRKSAL